MSIPKLAPLPFDHSRWTGAAASRRLAASVLSAASTLLARMADSLAEPSPAADGRLPRLEFHAENGAQDGALYLDGELIGRLPGVRRL